MRIQLAPCSCWRVTGKAAIAYLQETTVSFFVQIAAASMVIRLRKWQLARAGSRFSISGEAVGGGPGGLPLRTIVVEDDCYCAPMGDGRGTAATQMFRQGLRIVHRILAVSR